MLCVWVESSIDESKWWIIVERKDKSYHWTTPVDASEGYEFLSLVINTVVDMAMRDKYLLPGKPFPYNR